MDFKKLILFLLICFDLSVYSQQNNNWYFGAQAGLNFSNGQLQNTGCFVWIIIVKDQRRKFVEMKGSFVLIR